MEINVGVAEAEVTGTGVSVCVAAGAAEVNVGGTGVGVVKTSTEKLQAFSRNAFNAKIIIGRNRFCCFIAFSLSTLHNGTYYWNYKFGTDIKRLPPVSGSIHDPPSGKFHLRKIYGFASNPFSAATAIAAARESTPNLL